MLERQVAQGAIRERSGEVILRCHCHCFKHHRAVSSTIRQQHLLGAVDQQVVVDILLVVVDHRLELVLLKLLDLVAQAVADQEVLVVRMEQQTLGVVAAVPFIPDLLIMGGQEDLELS